MTSKIKLCTIIAIVALAGTITTSTLANAQGPPTENPGQPFQAILDKLAEIAQSIMDIGDNIDMLQSDVTVIKSDVEDIKIETDKIPVIKTDVDDIQTETDKIQMLVDEVANIKTQLANSPEPLTQFKRVTGGAPDGVKLTHLISSAGPLLVDVCNDASPDLKLEVYSPFGTLDSSNILEEDSCRTVGTNGADENIQVILNFDDEGFSFASINIRGLPSEEIIVSTTAIDF